MTDREFYLNRLYPFQDRVLHALSLVDTGFYLTGGTALSRVYLNHRFSEDLDFFVNDSEYFVLWADRVVQGLVHFSDWNTQVLLREERYVRLNLTQADINLKVELVNDVPSRVGEPWLHSALGRIDTAENILANKVTAVLDRSAPKDLADIWGLCCQKGLLLSDAITGAQGKAAGVFPVDLARVLCSATHSDWEAVRWINPPDPERFVAQLSDLGKSLIFPT
ncbi:MAG TPA: nucleotidyl transferase AbiEii/AbiGii toxin family protein [Anaerolineales bacterium]|nr:nucleotidyl transferase AbiEii/AbiGii toxin family protein [Anaerolineales bacterium]